MGVLARTSGVGGGSWSFSVSHASPYKGVCGTGGGGTGSEDFLFFLTGWGIADIDLGIIDGGGCREGR